MTIAIPVKKNNNPVTIKSFLFLNGDRYNLNELLKFVENFVSSQLSEFGNDYDDFDVSSWLDDDGDEEQKMDDPI